MNTGLFLVTRSRGPQWDDARKMEEQDQWHAHAQFMNALASDGFVVLGGPVVETPDTLLVIRATDETEIERRLAEDPWAQNDLLRTTKVLAWWLRLGSLPGPGEKTR